MAAADARGVYRVYQMSIVDGVWNLWDSPGFFQRFTGTFGDDGDSIAGTWEKSPDGSNWETELRGHLREGSVTAGYRRVKASRSDSNPG